MVPPLVGGCAAPAKQVSIAGTVMRKGIVVDDDEVILLIDLDLAGGIASILLSGRKGSE
jgi:hypothetical protein